MAENLTAKLVWENGMRLKSTGGSGHSIYMDAAQSVGGEDSAGRPKEMVIHGLLGCTAIDVLSILKKMRLTPQTFTVDADVEQTEDHPRVFSKIRMRYEATGEIPEDKMLRAVKLSQEQYCGVSPMLKSTATFQTEIILNGKSILAE